MSSEKTYTVNVKSTGETIKVYEWTSKGHDYISCDDHEHGFLKDELEFISETQN